MMMQSWKFSSVRLASDSIMLVCAMLMAGWALAPARAFYEAAPSVLTDAHLKIIRPVDFCGATGGPAPTAQSKEAVFGSSISMALEPVSAEFDVRFAGDYSLWIRLGQASGARLPVQVELSAQGKPVLSGRINEGNGAPGQGGLVGLRDYSDRAKANTPRNAAIKDMKLQMDHQGELQIKRQDDRNALDAGNIADELMQEMQQGTADQWVNLDRLETPGSGAYYWWKLGVAKLAPGRHSLKCNLVQAPGKTPPPMLDAAFLSCATNLLYPYAPDIAAPRASYVRFRIDKLPPGGVKISMSLLTHIYPYFWSGSGNCNPEGFRTGNNKTPHTKTGYTRWYSLQDLENSPGPNQDGHRTLNLAISGAASNLAGATQFAMMPYLDDVVREIDWNEPSGRDISIFMDFEKYPEQVRTVRDHAREHYDEALKATGGRLFPLTRQGISLHTGGGGCSDAASIDYTAKTLRLLGINSGGVNRYSGAFGVAGFSAGPWPGGWSPGAGEEAGRKKFIQEYQSFQKLSTNVLVTQMCDEPGEAFGLELSAPLWIWEEPENKPPRWNDYPGGSELHSRYLGYSNCVIEGSFERNNTQDWFDWRVGCDNATNPSTYGMFRIGKVDPYLAPENFAYCLVVNRSVRGRCSVVHKAAGVRNASFKIVWEGTRAALYLNNTLLAQLDGVPGSGGFGFAGNSKVITKLQVRPMQREERLGHAEAAVSLDAAPASAFEDIEAELGVKDEPTWMKPKPLKRYVEEDWLIGGGMPGLPAAYQAWLKGEGATPALFGKKQWEDVRPMMINALAVTPEMRRAYYWSHRYRGYLTPRLFALTMDGIRANAPRPDIQSYPALSGDSLDRSQSYAVDMFQLAQYTNGLMPGISDWSTGRYGEQAAAFNAAFFNAGARRFGRQPASQIMMHCVHPSVFRAYTCLANNVKYLSFYTHGPIFIQPYIDSWSEYKGCYPACSLVNNRVVQIDDLVVPGLLRPSRVAEFCAMSAHYWNHNLLPYKRNAFLALAQDYFQPELVNEDHVVAGALDHFDALYLIDYHVSGPAADAVRAWVAKGGILWACADAGTLNEYNEPDDLLEKLAGIKRSFVSANEQADAEQGDSDKQATQSKPQRLIVKPVAGEADFFAYAVDRSGMPASVACEGARVRAVYDDGRSAWLEKPVGRGRVVYLAHRAEQAYGSRILEPITAPLFDAGIKREVWLSQSNFMAGPLTTTGGTVVVLYNMQPCPRKDVTLFLRESEKPQSVEIFENYNLVPLQYTHADGVLSVPLPPFSGPQMLVVRNTQKPDDYARKWKDMRARTESLLEGKTDFRELSAGVFLAAADPEWGFGAKVQGFVSHESWFVRRQAAETLGRLGYSQAGDALAAAAAKETDAHALAEQMLALATFKHPKARALIQAQMNDESIARSVYAKRMAVCAAAELVFGPGAETNRFVPSGDDAKFAIRVAEAALRDPNGFVLREGILLLGRAAPADTVRRAVDAWLKDGKHQPFWVEAITKNPDTFNIYLAQDCPGDEGLFYSVAAAKQNPALLRALEKKMAAMSTNSQFGAAMAGAMARQMDKPLILKAMERRSELPPALVKELPSLLTRVFNTRLGADLRLWEQWLKANPPDQPSANLSPSKPAGSAAVQNNERPFEKRLAQAAKQ